MRPWWTDVLGLPQCLAYSAVFSMPGHRFPDAPLSLDCTFWVLLTHFSSGVSLPLLSFMLMCPKLHLSPLFPSFSISFPHSSQANHLVSLATSVWNSCTSTSGFLLSSDLHFHLLAGHFCQDISQEPQTRCAPS